MADHPTPADLREAGVITDEMVDAGKMELLSYDPDYDDRGELVCLIYQAMKAARSDADMKLLNPAETTDLEPGRSSVEEAEEDITGVGDLVFVGEVTERNIEEWARVRREAPNVKLELARTLTQALELGDPDAVIQNTADGQDVVIDGRFDMLAVVDRLIAAGVLKAPTSGALATARINHLTGTVLSDILKCVTISSKAGFARADKSGLMEHPDGRWYDLDHAARLIIDYTTAETEADFFYRLRLLP